jgi:hypothetical protein
VKKTNAAPAANTPFLTVWHVGGSAKKRVRYRVWYAFRTAPAKRHASAIKNVNLYMQDKENGFLSQLTRYDLATLKIPQTVAYTTKKPLKLHSNLINIDQHTY